MKPGASLSRSARDWNRDLLHAPVSSPIPKLKIRSICKSCFSCFGYVVYIVHVSGRYDRCSIKLRINSKPFYSKCASGTTNLLSLYGATWIFVVLAANRLALWNLSLFIYRYIFQNSALVFQNLINKQFRATLSDFSCELSIQIQLLRPLVVCHAENLL